MLTQRSRSRADKEQLYILIVKNKIKNTNVLDSIMMLIKNNNAL